MVHWQVFAVLLSSLRVARTQAGVDVSLGAQAGEGVVDVGVREGFGFLSAGALALAVLGKPARLSNMSGVQAQVRVRRISAAPMERKGQLLLEADICSAATGIAPAVLVLVRFEDRVSVLW